MTPTTSAQNPVGPSDGDPAVAGGVGTWTHPRTGEVYQNAFGEQPGPPWHCRHCDSELMTYNAPLDTNGSKTEKRIRLLHSDACSTLAGCTRKGCGKPLAEHEFGVFCP